MKSLKEFINEQLETPIINPIQEEQSPETTNTNIQENGQQNSEEPETEEVTLMLLIRTPPE